MTKYYWINGNEFIGLLKEHGYKWQGGGNVGEGGGLEKYIPDEYAHVPAIDHQKKILSIFPLEIYAPGSPTRDNEKYQKIVDMCGDLEDLKNDLAAACVAQ